MEPHMRTLKALSQAAVLLLLAVGAQAVSATCYLVFAPDNSVVFRSLQAPVDLSLPLHVTLPVVAPRGRLVFSPDNYGCELESNKLDTLRKVSTTPTQVRKRAQKRRQMRRAQGT